MRQLREARDRPRSSSSSEGDAHVAQLMKENEQLKRQNEGITGLNNQLKREKKQLQEQNERY